MYYLLSPQWEVTHRFLTVNKSTGAGTKTSSESWERRMKRKCACIKAHIGCVLYLAREEIPSLQTKEQAGTLETFTKKKKKLK